MENSNVIESVKLIGKVLKQVIAVEIGWCHVHGKSVCRSIR